MDKRPGKKFRAENGETATGYYAWKSLKKTCKDALQFFNVAKSVLKHLMYNCSVDIDVTVDQRVAETNHAYPLFAQLE